MSLPKLSLPPFPLPTQDWCLEGQFLGWLLAESVLGFSDEVLGTPTLPPSKAPECASGLCPAQLPLTPSWIFVNNPFLGVGASLCLGVLGVPE